MHDVVVQTWSYHGEEKFAAHVKITAKPVQDKAQTLSHPPLVCFHCRYIWKTLPPQLCGSRDVPMQDIRSTRPTQPCLQRDLCLPGGPLPALWCYLDDCHLQQAHYEAERDDWLACAGPEQQWGRGAGALGGNEGKQRPADMQVAYTAGILGLPRGFCVVYQPWSSDTKSEHCVCVGGGLSNWEFY